MYDPNVMVKLDADQQGSEVFVKALDGVHHYDFTQPHPFSDSVLIVGGRNFHVNKTYLAMHSPFFNSLFFSDFSEQSLAEVVLKEVNSEAFEELLSIIYPSLKPLLKGSTEAVLELADKFQIQRVVDMCETLLLKQADAAPLARKFLLAETYRLPRLAEWCLGQLHGLNDVQALEKTEEYRQLSDSRKVAVLEKAVSFCSSAHKTQHDPRSCANCGWLSNNVAYGNCRNCGYNHNSSANKNHGKSCSIEMRELMGMEVYSQFNNQMKLALLKKALGL